MPNDDLPPAITLTTDFGSSDAYAGVMKGIMLGINPRVTVIDISHDVRPEQILQAAFLTQTAWPYFPDGTIHLAVVDPGVGTARRAIVVESSEARFLGPDNGVLSSALPGEARPNIAGHVALPEGYRAFSITNRRYLREPLSATFHGRDVFAPAAAHLSLGVPIEELGERLDRIVALPALRAQPGADGGLEGRVVHIDRFGNVITDIWAADLPSRPFIVEIRGVRVAQFVFTYAGRTETAALIGSSGYLEIAVPNGNAARELSAEIGDAALLRRA